MKALLGLLKSKVFWANAITITLTILDEATVKCVSAENKALIIAVLNILLRFATNKPLTEK